jgi:hypothetical protein
MQGFICVDSDGCHLIKIKIRNNPDSATGLVHVVFCCDKNATNHSVHNCECIDDSFLCPFCDKTMRGADIVTGSQFVAASRAWLQVNASDVRVNHLHSGDDQRHSSLAPFPPCSKPTPSAFLPIAHQVRSAVTPLVPLFSTMAKTSNKSCAPSAKLLTLMPARRSTHCARNNVTKRLVSHSNQVTAAIAPQFASLSIADIAFWWILWKFAFVETHLLERHQCIGHLTQKAVIGGVAPTLLPTPPKHALACDFCFFLNTLLVFSFSFPFLFVSFSLFFLSLSSFLVGWRFPLGWRLVSTKL